MTRQLHVQFSLCKYWAQPTLLLSPKFTTLKTRLFSTSVVSVWSHLWAAQTLLGVIGCKSGQRLQEITPVYPSWHLPCFLTPLITSPAFWFWIFGREVATPRMPLEVGCPRQCSLSSLTLTSHPTVHRTQEKYDFPCNSRQSWKAKKCRKTGYSETERP